MAKELHGIQDIKEWFTFLICVAAFTGNKVTSGEGLGLMDLGKVLPILISLKPAIENSKMVGKQIIDMSEPEEAELKAHIETLEIKSEMVERKMEDGLKLMVDFADYIGDFFEEEPESPNV